MKPPVSYFHAHTCTPFHQAGTRAVSLYDSILASKGEHLLLLTRLAVVACLTFQQHASVSQGRICSDNFPCYHTEIGVADQTFYLAQSRYTDTRATSPSDDPIMTGVWQGSHWSANCYVTGMSQPGKIPSQAGFEPLIFRSRGGRLNH